MSKDKKRKAQAASPAPQPPAQPSEAELQRQHERWMAGLGAIKLVVQTVVIGGFVCLFAYVTFYLPVAAAHGEVTVITMTQTWLANVHAQVAIAWGLAGTGGVYGIVQKRKRIRERAQRDARIQELERQIDHGRTSSGLTPEGERPGGSST